MAIITDERGTWTLTIDGEKEEYRGNSFSRMVPADLVARIQTLDCDLTNEYDESMMLKQTKDGSGYVLTYKED